MMDYSKVIIDIASTIATHGGRAYFVGGYVRDTLLGLESKDYDIEVHGITPNVLENILDSFGERINIGKSFGIYSLKNYPFDIALPRIEHATGKGHKDFSISIDPFIGLYKAAIRRDFTINAMMQDIITGEIFDFFGGHQDLESKTLHIVNETTFIEDPLRVFRAAQFASRYQLTLSKETISLCKTIDLSELSSERIKEEMKKALLKSDHPSIFFQVLKETDSLDFWFPEIKNLIGVRQPEKYHGEGDVFNHTLSVLDQAAARKNNSIFPLAFMLLALTHDFGKQICTTEQDGIIHAYNHEVLGLPLVHDFLNRIVNENKIKKYLDQLIPLHMQPNMLAAQNSSYKSTNKLFNKTDYPSDLVEFSLCDFFGSIVSDPRIPPNDYLYDHLSAYQELLKKPHVTAQDLISSGISPGPEIKDALEYANKLKIAGIDHDNALKQTLGFIKSQKKLIK